LHHALTPTESNGVISFFGTDESPGPDLYSANELPVDLFGYGASRDKDGKGTTAWGPGAGLNYFFTRDIGVEAESYADALEIPYLLNGTGIFRDPINGTQFSIYGFGGFGRRWDPVPQWLGHIGAGGEYRFNPCGSFFADVSEEFPDQSCSDLAFDRSSNNPARHLIQEAHHTCKFMIRSTQGLHHTNNTNSAMALFA
jgi:hypothetical protein